MTVSLCMIVRNESAKLAACLASAADLVDDVVVVDTGSEDDTKAIAQGYGARVFDAPWRDDFSAARNESLRLAHGEWIFWLDADERLDHINRRRLSLLFNALPELNVAYLMRCRCVASDGEVTAEVDHARLFRKDARIRWDYRVHEQIVPSVRRAGGEVRGSDVVIVHEGYYDDATVRRKLERNLRLLELEGTERGLDPYVLFNVGNTLLELSRSCEALVALQLSRGLLPRNTVVARRVYALTARAHLAEGSVDGALASLRLGESDFPDDVEIAILLAEILTCQGELVEARAQLARTLSMPPTSDPTGAASFRAHFLLAHVCLLLGCPNDAEREVRGLLKERPTFAAGWILLGEALRKQGQLDELHRVVTTLQGIEGSAMVRLLLTSGLGVTEQARALVAVDDALADAPTNMALARARRRLLGLCDDRDCRVEGVWAIDPVNADLILSALGDRAGTAKRARESGR